jgi:hypothetical protein
MKLNRFEIDFLLIFNINNNSQYIEIYDIINFYF